MQENGTTRPTHYGGEENPFEPIKIIEHYGLGFCLGNAIKYILRAGLKDSATREDDLAKAAWYANRALAAEEAGSDDPPSRITRLGELYDENSYLAGMRDGAGSPSPVLRAVIYALQESGLDTEGRFVADADLEVVTGRGLEIERVEYDGEPGFQIRVWSTEPVLTETAKVVREIYGDGPAEVSASALEPYIGDPGDEHQD